MSIAIQPMPVTASRARTDHVSVSLTACSCDSGLPFAECCEPFLEGRAEPANAVALMRSRFTAFARGRAGYLWHTLHRDHDEKSGNPDEYRAHLERGLRGLTYKQLEVLDWRAPDREGVARVLFHATVYSRAKDISFMELSSFANDGTGWRYLFGAPIAANELGAHVNKISIAAIDQNG